MWRIITLETSTIHVYPDNDVLPHSMENDCICHPRFEMVKQTFLFIHNAWDNRELHEKVIAAVKSTI